MAGTDGVAGACNTKVAGKVWNTTAESLSITLTQTQFLNLLITFCNPYFTRAL